MNPFERLGRWCARHRRPVIVAWLALVGLSVPFALQAPGALRAGGFISPELESARAKALLETEVGLAEAAVADVPDAAYVSSVLPHSLSSRQVSADGHTAYDIVFLDLPADDSPKALPG